MSAPGNTLESADQVLRAVDTALGAAQASLNKEKKEEAFQLVNQALQKGIVHPTLLALRASWLEQLGRVREAIADLERARALAPQDVTILNALGECLTRADRLQEAIAVYDAAIAVKSDHAILHYNKGLAHEFLGEADAARASHERAVALDPNSSQALGRLSMLHADAKNWREARDTASKSLALDPLMVTAEFALIEADLAQDSLVEAETRAKSISDDTRHDLHARALARSYLADVFDKQGRTDEAFDASLAYGMQIRSVYRPQLAVPGAENALERVRRLARYFQSASPWRSDETKGTPQRGPVFLVGFPYSGVQSLQQVFQRHPGCVVKEHDAVELLAKTFERNDGGLDQLSQLTAERRNLLLQAYWQGVRQPESEKGVKIFVDCQLFNLIHLPIVAKLFPAAKTVLAIRDPRDVVLDCVRNRSGMNIYTYETLSLEGAAAFYDAVMQLAVVYREKLPLDLKQVRSEDLAQGGARDVLAFAGLAWDETLGEQIATMPESRSGWRRYAEQLAPVLPVLKPWIERFGYPEA